MNWVFQTLNIKIPFYYAPAAEGTARQTEIQYPYGEELDVSLHRSDAEHHWLLWRNTELLLYIPYCMLYST